MLVWQSLPPLVPLTGHARGTGHAKGPHKKMNVLALLPPRPHLPSKPDMRICRIWILKMALAPKLSMGKVNPLPLVRVRLQQQEGGQQPLLKGGQQPLSKGGQQPLHRLQQHPLPWGGQEPLQRQPHPLVHQQHKGGDPTSKALPKASCDDKKAAGEDG